MAINLFDFSQNQSKIPNATGYLSQFQKKEAPVLNFGAPMSGVTNFKDSWIAQVKPTPKPTAPTSSGFSVIPKANAMEEEDLLQKFLQDERQDNESKQELFRALQDWVNPNELINYLETSWYKPTQPVQQEKWYYWAAKDDLKQWIMEIPAWVVWLYERAKDRFGTAVKEWQVSDNRFTQFVEWWVAWWLATTWTLFDVAFTPVINLLEIVAPEKVEDVVRWWVEKLAPAIQEASYKIEQFANTSPEARSLVNRSKLLLEWAVLPWAWTTATQWAVKVAEATWKWVLKAWEKVVEWTKNIIPKTDITKVDLETTDLIRKAVRPSVTWVDTAWKYAAQDAKLLQWVKEVVREWYTPKNAKEAMEAIAETKNKIWAKVWENNKLVTKVTNGNELSDDIYRFVNDADNDDIFRANPELETRLIKYAEEIKNNKRFQALNQEQLQQLLTDTNSKIPSTSFLKQLDANPIETQKNAVISTLLRDKIENNLMEQLWTTNQLLRNSYWAVRQLEKDLAKRYAVYARQNPAGIADMFWADAIPDIIMWVMRWDIAWVVWWIAKRGIISKIKDMNNPNNLIKEIFKKQAKVKKLTPNNNTNVRSNPNDSAIINSNKPLQNNKGNVILQPKKSFQELTWQPIKPKVLPKRKSILSPREQEKINQLKKETRALPEGSNIDKIDPRTWEWFDKNGKSLWIVDKRPLQNTLKWATSNNINEVVQSVAKTLKTTKTAEIKTIIQRYLKEFWEDFKNKIWQLIEEIAEKVWAKINLVSSKEWIWVEKTKMLSQPIKAYHWTNVKFDKFDLWNKIWADNYWRAVYLTEDIKKAEVYANRAKAMKWWDKVILDVEIKPWLKLFDQSDKKLYEKLRNEMLDDWVYWDKSKPPFKTQQELDWLKSKWYEWIKSSITKEIAIFDPSNVKIKTEQANKPKLLKKTSGKTALLKWSDDLEFINKFNNYDEIENFKWGFNEKTNQLSSRIQAISKAEDKENILSSLDKWSLRRVLEDNKSLNWVIPKEITVYRVWDWTIKPWDFIAIDKRISDELKKERWYWKMASIKIPSDEIVIASDSTEFFYVPKELQKDLWDFDKILNNLKKYYNKPKLLKKTK